MRQLLQYWQQALFHATRAAGEMLGVLDDVFESCSPAPVWCDVCSHIFCLNAPWFFYPSSWEAFIGAVSEELYLPKDQFWGHVLTI